MYMNYSTAACDTVRISMSFSYLNIHEDYFFVFRYILNCVSKFIVGMASLEFSFQLLLNSHSKCAAILNYATLKFTLSD